MLVLLTLGSLAGSPKVVSGDGGSSTSFPGTFLSLSGTA